MQLLREEPVPKASDDDLETLLQEGLAVDISDGMVTFVALIMLRAEDCVGCVDDVISTVEANPMWLLSRLVDCAGRLPIESAFCFEMYSKMELLLDLASTRFLRVEHTGLDDNSRANHSGFN